MTEEGSPIAPPRSGILPPETPPSAPLQMVGNSKVSDGIQGDNRDADIAEAMRRELVAALPPEICGPLPQVELYCPKCSHLLTGAEEAGLDCCPECAEKVDFAELRRLARKGFDLRRYSYWQLCWQFILISSDNLEYKFDLYQPCAFVRLPPRPRSYFVVVGLVFLAGLAATLPAGRSAIFLALLLGGYGLLTVLIHAATWFWARWLLESAGHGDPDAGARRVLFVAATQYLPMAINLTLAMIGALGVELGSILGRKTPFVGLEAGITVISCILVGICGLAHFGLWFGWSSAVGKMLLAETHGRKPTRWEAVVRFFDPGWVTMMLGPFLLLFLLLLIGRLLYF